MPEEKTPLPKGNPSREPVQAKEKSNTDLALGLIFEEQATHFTLSRKEELELAKRVAQGDLEARVQLIEHNQGLVIAIAKECSYNTNLTLADLIQEGNLGLMRAIDKFNPDLGNRLSTYASDWIKWYIVKALKANEPLKISAHMHDMLNHIRLIREQLATELQREPTETELADCLKIKPKELRAYNRYFRPRTVFSLNEPIYGGQKAGSNKLNREAIVKSKEPTPDEVVTREHLQRSLEQIFKLAGLTDKETAILFGRYNIGDRYGKRITLRELGEQLGGVTRERIRQMEVNALKKLQRVKQFLQAYYHDQEEAYFRE
jgi:RNA polymerase primary sigma factor